MHIAGRAWNKSSLIMMKRNRKRRRTKRTGAKRRHIAGRAFDTGHGGSKATSKWQWARITLHAEFTKISLSQQNKFRLCSQQRGRREKGTNVKYDWQVSRMGTEISRLGGYGFWGTVTAGGGSNQKGGKMWAVYVNLRKNWNGSRERWDGKEGSSSNRLQLSAFVLVLRGTLVASQGFICATTKRWRKLQLER